MAVFQSPGRAPFFIIMSSSHPRYGIMASPPSFRISPETRSGPPDLFLPIALILLLMILISMVNGSPVRNIALAAEDCRIIEIKRISLF